MEPNPQNAAVLRQVTVAQSMGGSRLLVDHLIHNAEHGVYMARSQLEVIDRIGKQEAFGDALKNLVKRPKAS